jgi:hypothetical protein
MSRKRQRDAIAARITAEAARLALEERHGDAAEIRRRAARRLGCLDQRAWPDLAEVEEAVRTQQRLFRAAPQANAQQQLRRAAMDAMDMLAGFSPRLAGAVLEGTADENSPVRLFLEAGTPEDVIFFLADHRIPWEAGEMRLYFSRGRQETRPCLSFHAGGTRVELVVLQPEDRADPPIDPERNRPLRMAGRKNLR